MERVHIVAMIESEAGYGSKIDEKLYFKSEALALRYVKEYNKKYNNSPTVPRWYILAEYFGCEMVDMTNKQFIETWDF